MDSDTDPTATIRCDFCNLGREKVNFLIDGPTAYICDGCVETCVDIIAKAVVGKREGKKPEPIRCTFCQRSRGAVRKLATGPSGSICDECVDRVVKMLAVDSTLMTAAVVDPPSSPFKVPHPWSIVDSSLEYEIRQLVLRPHPNSVFDEEEFKSLVANTVSLSLEEKLSIINEVDLRSQEEIDALLPMLRDEQRAFAEIESLHSVRRAAREKRLRELHDIELEPNSPHDPPTYRLTAQDKAAILRGTIDTLVSPLGAGVAREFVQSFLSRIAIQLDEGKGASLSGTLLELFEPELRNATLNEQAGDPSRDGEFIDSPVRPTFTRLRATPVEASLTLRGRRYVVNLVIQDPGKSKGPIRVPFRVSVQIRPDSSWSLGLSPEQVDLRVFLFEEYRRPEAQRVFQVDRLGRFGLVAQVAAAPSLNDKTGWPALRLTFAVMRIIELLLPVLTDAEKAQLLSYVLDLPLAGAVPSKRFSDWFIGAAQIRDEPESQRLTDAFKLELRRSSAYRFTEKLFLLGLYARLEPGSPDRFRFSHELSSAATLCPADHSGTPISPDRIDVEKLIRDRVENFDDFLRMIEHHVRARVDKVFSDSGLSLLGGVGRRGRRRTRPSRG